MTNGKHAAMLSYGKDSLAMIHVTLDVLGLPLDRIITADEWATDTIPACLPSTYEFRVETDRKIMERWGIKVEHYTDTKEDGSKNTFDDVFHRIRKEGPLAGQIWGWPYRFGPWCNEIKRNALEKAEKEMDGCVRYIGIAANETERIGRWTRDDVVLPLVIAGWDETACMEWCRENGFLSPEYSFTDRSAGCWYCQNQHVNTLRLLRRDYPELWEQMLAWDRDTPNFAPFRYRDHGKTRTVQDFEIRFSLEDNGQIDPKKRYKWKDLRAMGSQVNLFATIDKESENNGKSDRLP